MIYALIVGVAISAGLLVYIMLSMRDARDAQREDEMNLERMRFEAWERERERERRSDISE